MVLWQTRMVIRLILLTVLALAVLVLASTALRVLWRFRKGAFRLTQVRDRRAEMVRVVTAHPLTTVLLLIADDGSKITLLAAATAPVVTAPAVQALSHPAPQATTGPASEALRPVRVEVSTPQTGRTVLSLLLRAKMRSSMRWTKLTTTKRAKMTRRWTASTARS